MAKGKNVSTRISEYQYNKLLEEAELYGFANFSEYVREKLSVPYIMDDLRKEGSSISTRLKEPINQHIVRLNYMIEQISGNQGHKDDMRRSVEAIWHLLNQ